MIKTQENVRKTLVLFNFSCTLANLDKDGKDDGIKKAEKLKDCCCDVNEGKKSSEWNDDDDDVL